MEQQLVIKLTSGDGKKTPVGLVENPPMLYTNLKALYPTVSFSDTATPSETEPYWYGVFEWNFEPRIHEVPHTKNVKALGLVKNSQGIWRPEFELVDATEEEINVRILKKAEQVRQRRNELLKLSDWVDLPIANITAEVKQKYDVYRHALRELPAQDGFPFESKMPVQPSEV
jgi:hypothetical protein